MNFVLRRLAIVWVSVFNIIWWKWLCGTYLCRYELVSSMDRFVAVYLFCPNHFGCHLPRCHSRCPCPSRRHSGCALTSPHWCGSHCCWWCCCCWRWCCYCLNLMDCFDLLTIHCRFYLTNVPHSQPPSAIVWAKYHGPLLNPVDLI